MPSEPNLNILDIKVGTREIRNAIRNLILSKSEITSDMFTSANGGMKLPHRYALGWLRKLGDNTMLKKSGMVEFYEFRGNESQINAIDWTDMAMYPQVELTDHRYYTGPTFDQITLSPQWFSAKFMITDQDVNVATETDLGGLFLELMAMKLANEYEKLMIHGNKIGQNTSRAKAYDDYDPDKVSIDPTFIKTDGIISLAVADGIQVDCSTWETKYFNPEICKEMLMAIAEEQQFLLQSMQFMVSPRAYEDFYEHCENKGVDTASLQWVLGTMPIQYHKKLIHGVPLWDNNPRQVKKAKITSSGGTVDLPYVPIVEDSDKFIPHTEGTFYTPYVNGTADDYTLDLTTGKVTHTGTDTSSIPLDTFINFTYKGPGVAVMTFPGNFKFAVNTDTVKIEHDRVVNDATDLYVSHTSGDIAMWRADACVWTNVQNKTPTLAS